MRIVVLSDTHMPRMARTLPAPLVADLKRADAIIHAGDWTSADIADQLSAYAPLEGVAGNNDGPDLVKRFGYRKIVKYGSIRIGLVHGHGEGGRGDTTSRAWNAFHEEEVDIIVFGHSHIPLCEERDGILLFNPGSPTDKRRQPQYSYGVLDLTGDQIEARHVFYAAK